MTWLSLVILSSAACISAGSKIWWEYRSLTCAVTRASGKELARSERNSSCKALLNSPNLEPGENTYQYRHSNRHILLLGYWMTMHCSLVFFCYISKKLILATMTYRARKPCIIKFHKNPLCRCRDSDFIYKNRSLKGFRY